MIVEEKTALVEKQREEQERQMIQRRQEEELFRLQQEALMEKQREEDMMRQPIGLILMYYVNQNRYHLELVQDIFISFPVPFRITCCMVYEFHSTGGNAIFITFPKSPSLTAITLNRSRQGFIGAEAYRWYLFAIHVHESTASLTGGICHCRLHDSPRRHLFDGATFQFCSLIEAPAASLNMCSSRRHAICRWILEPHPPCPPGQPATINGMMLMKRMSAPPPGTAPTVLPPPISVPSTMPASGPGVLPPGIDVSGPPMSGLSGPNMAPPPPQLRGPPPSVAMPPPPGMEMFIMEYNDPLQPIGMGPPGVGPPGVGPPGVDSDDESRSDRKLPSLLSLKVEPPVEVKEVKLPIALEQALAFKTERAKQVGVQPEDYVKLENIPEAPPAPVISRSGLVDEIDDEDDEDQNQSGRKQKSVQQPEQDQRQSKNKRKKKRKKRAKHRQQELQKQKAEEKKDPDEETGEKEPDVEIEYIQETLGLSELDPMYRQFARIFETFRISEPEKSEDANKDLIKELIKEPELKKVPKLEDEYEEEEEEEEKKEEEKTKLSKRKLKKLTRLSVAELKQLVNRPDVVEMHDVTARDPKLLVQLKAHRNTVPVPRHWCFKRKYLQGKRGIEKPPFDLPDFIKKTGIMEMRAALQEKEDQRTLKAKMRERARPKLGKIDIDYQKLHDAFFKFLDMLEKFLFLQIEQTEDSEFQIIFQQDGAPPHFAIHVSEDLDCRVLEQWIGRNAPIPWPTRSPDLYPSRHLPLVMSKIRFTGVQVVLKEKNQTSNCKWQTKPRMSIHGDLYYEGKEFETRLKEKKPGDLSEELRTALGMPVGPSANKVPPPWLIAMQRYGPPPSYPNLKIPGLNAPIPEGCSFGYHAGGWGKPPVDETGRPLYGDVFGVQGQDYQSVPEEEEVDRTIWGELESESEEESEEEEEDEEEGEKEDETGLVTPAEGLITPSGITSIPAGMETPEIIELRKRKIESEMEGSETPVLYQVLPEKRMDRVGGAMMASTHIYDMTGAGAPPPGVIAPTRRGGGPEGPGTVELALDPSELDLVDTDAMAVRYEQQIREQQSQLQKEDLSDMLADHVARQKYLRVDGAINAHTPTEEKDDHIKDNFYEELEHSFDQLPRYHMKILLGDFNAKVGREYIFRPTIGKKSLHAISSDSGVRLVNFATSKNLIVKSTTFPHKDIHKYTWTSPDGLTHNQIDHILIDKRRHTSIVDIRTFTGADCNSDHYLVIGELRERLSVAKRVEQQVNITKFNILKLKDEEAKQNYQVEISNRFATLESSDEVEKELDVNSVWENIRDSIKIAAEQSIGYYETKKKKPWFDEDCCMVVERSKQAKLKFLQDPVEENRDNYFNERWEASHTLRNKKRDYLKGKVNEETKNSKNKNIRDLYKGIKEFKNGYQPRVNVIKDENGDLLADSPSILNRWKNYFAQLLNVHRPNRNDRDEIEIQTAEPFIPKPTLSEVEIAIENLKNYKSPGIDQIPAELIQEGGNALYSEIYKLVLAIWEKEIVPEQWKESIIAPIFKKGDKTNCGNF
ncbi:hypothetical protein ANN_23794 [Periplaneta americana]|uniref:PSP proline-rich domain-containing protein n=1 Tax=Periplaneta americana TaxID=6978 RepID=A0ABQ8SNB1_PERAM|nr:hypothetical protein ANN_23794 [Periplaneta americana]